MQSYCRAHCRTTGAPCRNFSMPNGRCRMHGGSSTGRPIKTGYYTKEDMKFRREIRRLSRSLNELMRSLEALEDDS